LFKSIPAKRYRKDTLFFHWLPRLGWRLTDLLVAMGDLQAEGGSGAAGMRCIPLAWRKSAAHQALTALIPAWRRTIASRKMRLGKWHFSLKTDSASATSQATTRCLRQVCPASPAFADGWRQSSWPSSFVNMSAQPQPFRTF